MGALMDPDHDGLYPGNPDEAQDRIRNAIGAEWSRWELTCHEIELSTSPEGSQVVRLWPTYPFAAWGLGPASMN